MAERRVFWRDASDENRERSFLVDVDEGDCVADLELPDYDPRIDPHSDIFEPPEPFVEVAP